MKRVWQAWVASMTGATAVRRGEVIQSLWSGYGEVVRLHLEGAEHSSVILKHILLPAQTQHPRGWNTDRSHQRKIHSYQVEMHWYQQWSQQCDAKCRVAACYGVQTWGDEHAVLLEDLDASGFFLRRSRLSVDEVKAGLAWLASFHARFMGVSPEGLWQEGTYWHLATRPDEWAAMQDFTLKKSAAILDRRLKQAQFQTLLHGDAKVANFCFSPVGDVAAVDFQYVGGGCGMKDVAYFLGSGLSDMECEQYQESGLDHYFQMLHQALDRYGQSLDHQALEAEWRSLYAVAWADFYRFLNGWQPHHRKINDYGQRLTQQLLARIEVG